MRAPKIFYISGYSHTRSRNANLTGVMYMVEAFQNLDCDVVAFLFGDKFQLNGTCRFWLDEEVAIKASTMPMAKIKGIYAVFDMLAFVLALFYRASGRKIYSRNARVSKWLYRFGITCMFEIHDLSPATRQTLAIGKSNTHFCINQYLVDVVREEFGHTLVYHLPDAAKISAAGPSPFDPQTTNLVYVGSNNEGKGVAFINDLAARLPDLRFHLYGNVTLPQAAPNVVVHGFCDKATINAAMAGGDILLAPYGAKVLDNAGNDISRTMSPLKLFEYMASQRPFIISDLPFVTEIVTHQRHCVLAKPDDLDDWIRAIEHMLENSEQGAKMAANAKNLLAADYDWQQRARRVLATF